MSNKPRKNSNNTARMQPQSKEFKHEFLAVQDLTCTANTATIGADITAETHHSDNKSTEYKQQLVMNTTQAILTLGNLALLEKSLSYGIDHWMCEEKKDGGVSFYRE